MKAFLCLVLTLSSISSQVLWAQEYIFESDHLTVEDGLSSRFCYNIIQDRSGDIWVSTNFGVNRYDGRSFTTFNRENANLLDDFCRKVLLDVNGNIWAVHNLTFLYTLNSIDVLVDGASSFRPLKEVYSVPPELMYAKITYLQNDNKDRIWITTADGSLYLFDGTFQQAFSSPNHQNIQAGIAASDSTFWLLTRHTLLEVNAFGNILSSDSLRIELLSDLKVDDHGRLWITGLVEKTEKAFSLSFYKKRGKPLCNFFKQQNFSSPYTPNRPGFKLKVCETISIPEGILVVNVNSERLLQLLLYDHSGKLVYQAPQESLDKIAYDPQGHILVDRTGKIWLPSTNGLYILDIRINPFQQYLVSAKPSNASTRAIIPLSANRVWVNSTTGMHIFDLETKEEVGAILANSGNQVLVQSYGGIYLENDQVLLGTYGRQLILADAQLPEVATIEHFMLDSLGEYPIPYRSSQTKRVWLGTSRGLYEYLPATENIVKYHSIYLDGSLGENKIPEIRSFRETEEGLWLITNRGLILWDEEKGIQAHFDHFPYKDLLHLHIDDQGVFWMASKGGGLIKWDKQKDEITQLTSQTHQLSNDVIYSVYEDQHGYLWLPSNIGLMRMNKQNYEITTYEKKDGIPHEEFNTASHQQMSDGRLLFGGLNGFISFYPDEVPLNNPDIMPRILHYRYLGATGEHWEDRTSELRNNGRIELPHQYIGLELEFTLTDYFKSEEQLYAYSIEGFDESWQFTDENVIRFNRLPAGKYVLHLKGRDYSGLWSSRQLSIDIHVAPPFFVTPGFIFSFVAGVLVLFYLVLHWREARLRAAEQQLQEEVDRQTRELLELNEIKNRIFAVIGHEMRSPLTAMQGIEANIRYLLEKGEIEKSIKFLRALEQSSKKLSLLLDNLLYWGLAQKSQLSYQPSNINVAQLLGEVLPLFDNLMEQKQIQVQQMVPETLSVFADENGLSIILRNILSNAIKFTPEEGKVYIKAAETADYVHLQIRDTGVGIQPSIFEKLNKPLHPSTKGTRGERGTGLGLALCYDLVKVNKGSLAIESAENQGTSVLIKLPLSRKMLS